MTSLRDLVLGAQSQGVPQSQAVYMGSRSAPGVAPVNQRPTFRFYVYPLQFSNLVAGTVQSGFIKIDAKYRFITYGLSYGFFNPAALGVNVTPQNVEIRISDTASGKFYSNAATKIGAVAGISQKYYRYSVPLVFEKNGKVQIDMNPIAITAANPPDLWLCFHGAQIAEYGG